MSDFDKWWSDVQALADVLNWPLGAQEEYREYFDDGYSPEMTVAEERSYADG